MKEETHNWEKEFDEADFGVEFLGSESEKMIKSFITTIIEKERAAAREKGRLYVVTKSEAYEWVDEDGFKKCDSSARAELQKEAAYQHGLEYGEMRFKEGYECGKSDAKAKLQKEVMECVPEKLPEELGHYGKYDALHIQNNIGYNECREATLTALQALFDKEK